MADDNEPTGQDRQGSGDKDTGQGANGPQNGAGGDSGASGEDQPRSNREAAYRIRAKEAEATAQALMERVEKYQRAEIERAARDGRMLVPGDLWRYDVELVELLDDETGDLDPEKVTEALAALEDSHPHLFKPMNAPNRGPGFGQGSGHPAVRIGDPEFALEAFSDLLRGIS
jgi:hypothetical protein